MTLTQEWRLGAVWDRNYKDSKRSSQAIPSPTELPVLQMPNSKVLNKPSVRQLEHWLVLDYTILEHWFQDIKY